MVVEANGENFVEVGSGAAQSLGAGLDRRAEWLIFSYWKIKFILLQRGDQIVEKAVV